MFLILAIFGVFGVEALEALTISPEKMEQGDRAMKSTTLERRD